VTPDKEKPFIITIMKRKLMVLGTSFNIKAENGNTEVVDGNRGRAGNNAGQTG